MVLPRFLLQRAYHVPAANIVLAASGTVNDGPSESEMRVVDCFSTPGGDCLQPLGVKIGPGRLIGPVERVEEADMRRDEWRRADYVAQPLTEFAQFRSAKRRVVDPGLLVNCGQQRCMLPLRRPARQGSDPLPFWVPMIFLARDAQSPQSHN